jgi:hypothetical protein
MGDLALDRISAWHYDFNHKSKMNSDFVKAFNAEYKRTDFAVGGYDGCTSSMRLSRRQGRMPRPRLLPPSRE